MDPNQESPQAETPETPQESTPGQAQCPHCDSAATIRELREQIEHYKRLSGLEEIILESGATPEQFGHALGYINAVNSGDRTLMERALGALEHEAAMLEERIGRSHSAPRDQSGLN